MIQGTIESIRIVIFMKHVIPLNIMQIKLHYIDKNIVIIWLIDSLEHIRRRTQVPLRSLTSSRPMMCSWGDSLLRAWISRRLFTWEIAEPYICNCNMLDTRSSNKWHSVRVWEYVSESGHFVSNHLLWTQPRFGKRLIVDKQRRDRANASSSRWKMR